METDYITRKEHEEFSRRLEGENTRQNERLHLIEKSVNDILIPMQTSVEKLAMNMQNMLEEQRSQGKRLETLEKRDGEKWRDAVKCVVTALIGAVVGYFAKKLGL